MKAKKQRRLEDQGWKFGTACDFLELTSEEKILVAIKLAFSQVLRDLDKHK